ncbi:MAG: response regulator [Crocinitomicaceae bacterium]|nr:response regulator [Crocinitomicaceae bacterium]
MKTQKILHDYYGASYFIESNKHRQLVIFIIDDNRIYLNILKRVIKRPNYSVFTFSTGEECLEYLSLKPDLVILDYHLDSINPYAQNGDQIYNLIKEESPDTEIFMISSDKKFSLISELHLAQTKNVIFKDESTLPKLQKAIKGTLKEKNDTNEMWHIKLGFGIFFFFIISIIIFLFLR